MFKQRSFFTLPIHASAALAVSFGFLLVPLKTHAISASWIVDASGNWNLPGNWSTSLVPGSTSATNTDVATFSLTLTAARTITVDSPRFIGGITLGNTSLFGYTLSGGALTLNSGGVIQTTGNGAHTDTISTPITIAGTSAATASITANSTSSGNHLIIGAVAGSATAGNTTTLTLNGSNVGRGGIVADAGDNVVNGTVADGAGGGRLALTKAGTGLWMLSGANTYTGVTSVNAGTLVFAKAASLYNGASSSWTAANVKVASGATAAFGVGGVGEFTTTDVTTLLGTLTTGINNNGFQAGSSIGFYTALAATTFTVADVITDSTGTGGGSLGVTKLGLGALVLGGANTYTGITRVAQGTVTVSPNVDLSAANGGWNIGNSDNSSTQSVTFSAGSAIVVAAGKTFQLGALSASGATATLNVAGNVTNNGALNAQRTAVFNINNGGTWVQSGAMLLAAPAGSGNSSAMTVQSGGSFTYDNPATSLIQVSAASNGNGNATLNIAGTFTTNQGFINTIATTTGSGVATISLSGGTLKLSADVPVLTATAGTAFNFTLGAGGGTIDTQAFATTMSRPIGGTTALTKRGTGTLTLSATNTYTGATIVNAGTLQVGEAGVGSTTAGSSVSLNGSGVVLAGTGTVAGAITVTQGTIRPGDTGGSALGILNTGSVTVNGGANAVVELQLNATTPGSGDKVVSSGSLTFTAASHLSVANAPTVPGTWDLLDWANVLNFGNNILSTTSTTGGSIGTTDNAAFLDLPTLGGDLYYDLSQFIASGQISVMGVPEPGRMLLGVAGLAGIALRRRRCGPLT